MTVLESLAEEHRKATTAAQTSGFRRNVATWNQVDFNNVVDSWQQQLPRVTRVAEDVQEFSVIDAAAFMTVASAVQGRDIDDQINVDSYVGAMPYTGADLDAAFAGPAYRTLEAVRQNKPPNVAMYAGVAELARLTHAVTFDTAEEASLTVALSQHLTYQRIPQVGCCVRCSMLTGQYFTSKVFKRHPHCRCVHIPVLDPADAPKRSNDPYELFNALSEEEQNKIWTKAGAQAIRDGADIYQVGNSLTRPLPHRRSRRFTSEGAGKHGWYRNNAPAGKAGKRRLTVHEIYRRADGDTHTAKRLMREYGYLLGPQDPNGLNAGLHMTNAGKKWLKQKALNEWKAAHGVWDRSVRQPKAWDAFPDLHKRVADLQATRAVARTLERQRVYQLRVHAYEAIALAEAGRRVVNASRPVPGPSPSLGSRRPVRPQENKPATATGGAGGRGNGNNRSRALANGGYPSDWEKYETNRWALEDFDVVDWFGNSQVQARIKDVARLSFEKHKKWSKESGSKWSADVETYEDTLEIVRRSLSSEVDRRYNNVHNSWTFEFEDPVTRKRFRVAIDANSPVVTRSIHPVGNW